MISQDIAAVMASIEALEEQTDQSRYAYQNLEWSRQAMETYEAEMAAVAAPQAAPPKTKKKAKAPAPRR
jgi:uncharacterized membrane protein YccC